MALELRRVRRSRRIVATGSEFPRYSVLPIRIESTTINHPPQNHKLFDMWQSESLSSVDLLDPEVVVKGLVNQTCLLLGHFKDLWRDVFRPETI